MYYKIEMKEGTNWYPLGGRYDAATADERVSQFTTCFSSKAQREFRVVKADGNSEAGRDSAGKFPAERTSRSPR